MPAQVSLRAFVMQVVFVRSFRGWRTVRPGVWETLAFVFWLAVLVWAIASIVSGDVQCGGAFRCGS